VTHSVLGNRWSLVVLLTQVMPNSVLTQLMHDPKELNPRRCV
jgi:hypothetical protein